MPLDTAMLALLRQHQQSQMDLTAQISRPGAGRDAGGGVLDAPVVVTTTPCRAWVKQSPSDEQDAVDGGGVKAVVRWNVLLPYDADVRPGDRLEIGTSLLRVSATDGGKSDQINQLAICYEVS